MNTIPNTGLDEDEMFHNIFAMGAGGYALPNKVQESILINFSKIRMQGSLEV